jgi:hypothetical protein
MTLHPLSTIEEGVGLQLWYWPLYNAKVWLQFLLNDQLIHLVVSRGPASNLLNAIDAVLPTGDLSTWSTIGPERKLNFVEAYTIKTALESFETVFSAELPTVDTYVVAPKGIYLTADLVERAEYALDEACRDVIPLNAVTDFNQAGRSLAFELPTGAGFHTMRATEAVLRQYWSLVKKAPDGTKPPEMAQCINEVRAAGEDPKLMDILDHVRDLHRNALMHPEIFLTTQDALRLFDISKSAISAMSDRITTLKTAEAAAITTMAAAASSA